MHIQAISGALTFSCMCDDLAVKKACRCFHILYCPEKVVICNGVKTIFLLLLVSQMIIISYNVMYVRTCIFSRRIL